MFLIKKTFILLDFDWESKSRVEKNMGYYFYKYLMKRIEERDIISVAKTLERKEEKSSPIFQRLTFSCVEIVRD